MKTSGTVMAPSEATASVLASVLPLQAESCALRVATDRVLRQDVFSERDNPPFDRVCMDGIAIHSSGLQTGRREFLIAATQGAGAIPMQLPGVHAAIEVACPSVG